MPSLRPFERVALEAIDPEADIRYLAFKPPCELVQVAAPEAPDGDDVPRAFLKSLYGDLWVDKSPVFAFSTDSTTFVVALLDIADKPTLRLQAANNCDIDPSVLESLKFQMLRGAGTQTDNDQPNHVLVFQTRPKHGSLSDGVDLMSAALRQFISAQVKNPLIECVFGSYEDAELQQNLRAENEWGDSSDFAVKNKGRYAMVVLHTCPHLFTPSFVPTVSSLLKSRGQMLWTTCANGAKVKTLPEQTFARMVKQFDDKYADKWYVSFTDFQVVSPGQFIKT